MSRAAASAPDPDSAGHAGELTRAGDRPLSAAEAGYVEAARAANTLRGYRSDWREFSAWCTTHRLDPLPAAPGTVTGYLTDLARPGPRSAP